ncbi:PREDICTED: sterile alpha motif domain-containing protein 15 [Miniopterus natalensis]|uniref:sterile alpha motif domain-containing protein 15 n=1 Tax=Miniopterus natalensis TaxID=291302 RepID=UPI0007A6C711|nr:PREDICTED: sterile alpha motif domain-containing protein 15 [Miniopterus natalensis]
MAEAPEEDGSGPRKGEDLGPGPLQIAEDAEPDITAEADPELPEKTDQEPQPEAQEENLKDRTLASAKNMHPHLKPTWMFEGELSKKSEADLSSEIETGIPQKVMSEVTREMIEFLKDLAVTMDEKPEDPDLEPSEEAKADVTEDVVVELAQETHLELPKETESEAPRAAANKTRLELLKEIKGGFPEELLREQNEESSLEPPEQAQPEFPSKKPRKSIGERDLQPPKMATPEFPEETQRKSSEENRPEPSEPTKLEFPKEKPRKSGEEAGLEPPEETKPGVAEEIARKPTEEKGTEQPEQTKPEFPDQKPSKFTEGTGRKATKGEVPEPVEEIKSEFPEEKSRKLIEKRGLESSEKTKPEIQEETQRKSTVEKVLEPPEDTEATVQKNKQRKSTMEIGLAPPQKSKSGDTLRESTEEKDLEPPEQTTPGFPKEEPKTQRKSTENTGQVPLQKMRPEVQERTQTEPTKEKDLELPDKAKPLLRQEAQEEFTKEDRPERIKFKHFVDKDRPENSDYQTRKLFIQETEKVVEDSSLASFTVREVGLENIGDEFPEEPPIPGDFTDSSNDFYSPPSESQRDLRNSISEKDVDLPLKLMELVPCDKETQTEERTKLQFECLKWSPEEVAKWISKLGFPQYQECFTTNFISGRKLIHVNCSNLPQMGITDFEDMKVISRHTRELLGIEEPLFNRTICLPYRDNIGLFLEQKGHTGVKSDSLTLSEFVQTAGLQDYEPQIPAPDDENEGLYYTEPQEKAISLSLKAQTE